MAGSQRKGQAWSTNATEVVPVMRALAPIVHAAGRSLPRYVATEGFKVVGATAHVEEVDSLEVAAAQLPEPVNAASLSYSTKLMTLLWGRPVYSIDLDVFKGKYKYNASDLPDAKVNVELGVKGPIGDSTAGLIDRVRRQVETEVTRQNNAGWNAPPIHVSATPTPANDPGQQKFWTKTRKWIAAAASAVTIAVLGQIATDWVKQPDNPAPPQPATTTTQPTSATPTATTTTTPPSPAQPSPKP